MSTEKIKAIITSFCPVSPGSMDLVERHLAYSTIPKGTHIIEKGKPDRMEYFILDGICKSYLINPEGEEVTLSFFMAGSVLSPYVTRTRDGLSLLNIRTLTEISLAAVEASVFESLMVENLEIRTFGNTVLRNELIDKAEKEIGLASLPAKERLEVLRQKYPNLENLVPHSDIASYLGITHVSLSRLRKNR